MPGCRMLTMVGLLMLPWLAVAGPAPVRLCASNQGDYPWVLTDRPGLNQLLIERAAARSGVPVEFHLMRWGHCLLRLSDGRMEGAFNSSFIPERQAFARFPLRDGKPDGERRLMRSGYHLFQRKAGTAQWDGTVLEVAGPVGVPSGSFAITRRLREVGLGYLRLVQAATELSGGEAQRIKLATELQRTQRGDTLTLRAPGSG